MSKIKERDAIVKLSASTLSEGILEYKYRNFATNKPYKIKREEVGGGRHPAYIYNMIISYFCPTHNTHLIIDTVSICTRI